MRELVRFHDVTLRERLPHCRTVFVSGPAQVGRTTSCKALSTRFLDWDDVAHRLLILKGPDAVAKHLDLDRSREVTVVFDNLQGHRGWKDFLRKFQLRCSSRVRVVDPQPAMAVSPASTDTKMDCFLTSSSF